MSETEQILDRFSESQGWTPATQLDLALTYIENQGSPGAWEDYLTSLKEADDEWDGTLLIDPANEDPDPDPPTSKRDPRACFKHQELGHFDCYPKNRDVELYEESPGEEEGDEEEYGEDEEEEIEEEEECDMGLPKDPPPPGPIGGGRLFPTERTY
jgi:hypothetical protein